MQFTDLSTWQKCATYCEFEVEHKSYIMVSWYDWCTHYFVPYTSPGPPSPVQFSETQIRELCPSTTTPTSLWTDWKIATMPRKKKRKRSPCVVDKNRNQARKHVIDKAHKFGERFGLQAQHEVVRAYHNTFKTYKQQRRLALFPLKHFEQLALQAVKDYKELPCFTHYNQVLLQPHRERLKNLLQNALQKA